MKLCFSRAFWLVAYPSQGHEMLFDAHTRSFRALGGVARRGIYDNMKTAVDKISKGKGRIVNARFAVMCAHHWVDADFCNVASGWEKGVAQVLAAVPTAGLDAVLVAVELGLESGAVSAEHVINVRWIARSLGRCRRARSPRKPTTWCSLAAPARARRIRPRPLAWPESPATPSGCAFTPRWTWSIRWSARSVTARPGAWP